MVIGHFHDGFGWLKVQELIHSFFHIEINKWSLRFFKQKPWFRHENKKLKDSNSCSQITSLCRCPISIINIIIINYYYYSDWTIKKLNTGNSFRRAPCEMWVDFSWDELLKTLYPTLEREIHKTSQEEVSRCLSDASRKSCTRKCDGRAEL